MTKTGHISTPTICRSNSSGFLKQALKAATQHRLKLRECFNFEVLVFRKKTKTSKTVQSDNSIKTLDPKLEHFAKIKIKYFLTFFLLSKWIEAILKAKTDIKNF